MVLFPLGSLIISGNMFFISKGVLLDFHYRCIHSFYIRRVRASGDENLIRAS